MFRFPWRPIAVISILLVTVGAFINYFVTHDEVRQQISQTTPGVLIALLALYLIFMFSLGLIFQATLKLCRIKLPLPEVTLVTMYSSIINFFGPLQSGPAFRGVYLKKKHNVSLKNYTAATLAYYGFYALFSGLFLLSGVLGWWLVAIVALSALLFLGLRYVKIPIIVRFWQLDLRGLYVMAAATISQILIITTLFFVELKAVDPHVTFGQTIIYTGAANFALFVSITPGAIGFRESFLVLSQHLHHISNSTIVAANLLDRTAYICMLLLLVVFIFGTHARNRLRSVTKD
ncbi:MAG: lysylphosphatidylglycerol synthase domain-containing protein [Candidatus Saccharibacteria bacterium]